MAENGLERLLAEMDPGKRAFLKTLIAGGAFAVPTLASFSVKDLSLAEAASGPTTETTTATTTGVTTTTTTALISDRNAKERFAAVDSQAILSSVMALPIQTWNYKGESPSVRHIGPMAQDFAASFGVGEDDRHIHVLDANGVALAALQGVHQLVERQHAQIQALTSELAALQAEHRALWAELSAFRGQGAVTT